MEGKSMLGIASAAAQSARLPLADLRGPSRARGVVWVRQDAMFLMHQAGFSTTQIGRFFHRDHSTVLHGINAARSRKDQAKGPLPYAVAARLLETRMTIRELRSKLGELTADLAAIEERL